jgi:ubiquinone biosynthesis monooxygenase Coq7
MLEQEKVHLATFNRLLPDYRVRPTAMRPLWNVAGLALGVSSALLGPRGAMMCTEAVETVIGEHYNDQLRQLHQLKSMNNNPNDGFQQLRQTIKKFRDEELEHLDHAVSRESRQAPMHSILSEVIKSGCRAAIWISERI